MVKYMDARYLVSINSVSNPKIVSTEAARMQVRIAWVLSG
jgi:hypothetical protein